MMENSSWRIITIIVCAVIIAFCIIAAIPFITVPHEILETYYETAVKQETYIAKESYIDKDLIEKQEVIFNGTPFTVPFGITVPLEITKPNAELIGHFELPGSGGFRIRLPSNKILYEQLGQIGDFRIPLSKGEYTAILRDSRVWGQPAYLNLIVKWTEAGEVTKYREVTKIREVPVQVEKQRPITKYKKSSLWELIFGST
jgi:hypothetical protein